MIVKLLTEHHLEFLSLTGGCRGSSDFTHVKMPHCWKSYVMAYMSQCQNSSNFERSKRKNMNQIKRYSFFHESN